jgi:carbamoyl-phosphate synthase large subunit
MKYARQAKIPVRIIAADMDAYSAAKLISDVFIQVPPANSPDYSKRIAEIVEEHRITMVAPCLSFGFDALANLDHSLFLNEIEVSKLCSDKWRFYQWCQENAMPTPYTALLSDAGQPRLPCYIKPRVGAGAKNNYTVYTVKQHHALLGLIDQQSDYIAQDLTQGEHWVIEAMRLNSELISCVTMQVLIHKAGNAQTVKIIHNPALAKIADNLLSAMNFQGPANIDVIRDKTDSYFVLEVNPRFGSTIEFIAAAGHNTPAFLLTRQQEYLANVPKGVFTTMRQGVSLTSH